MEAAPLALALTLALATFASPSVAQQSQDGTRADQQIVLKRLETDQRAAYALNLGLTADESKVFWPIYDQYEADMKKVTDQRLALLNEYAGKYRTLSGDDATAMLATFWKCEQEALKVRQRHSKQVQAVLPAVKALRYVQLQARIDNHLVGRVLSQVPLAN
jgi:hypothetical protein